MTIIRIKHGDISKMNMDELRELKTKWDKVNKMACRFSTYFLAPIAFMSIIGVTKAVILFFTLAVGWEFFMNLFPLVMFTGLTLFLVKMKNDDIKGYVGTIALYLTLCVAYYSVFTETVFVFLIPTLFIIRCLINYDILKKMREMPGYPFFIYTVAEKFADQVYIQDKRFSEIEPVSPEEYIPWNAFDENEDENTTDNKDIKGEG